MWLYVLPVILSPIAYAIYVAWDFFRYPVIGADGKKIRG